MALQGSGYTHEAGAETEHCNGDGALGQGAAVPGGAFGNVTENEAPPPPRFLCIRLRGSQKASKGQFCYNREIPAKDSTCKIIKYENLI